MYGHGLVLLAPQARSLSYWRAAPFRRGPTLRVRVIVALGPL